MLQTLNLLLPIYTFASGLECSEWPAVSGYPIVVCKYTLVTLAWHWLEEHLT